MSEIPTGIPSSFIPHDVTEQVEPRRRFSTEGAGLVDLFVLLSIVLCIASVALGVGVFLYQQYLTTSAASKKAQLQRARAAFEPSLITQFTRLDDRMHAASEILNAHLAPTEFFHLLEQSTLQTVSFRTLQFQAPDPQHMTISMEGVARSVNSVALQGDLFGKSSVITSPIFSGINRATGGVQFTVNAHINPSLLRYETLVNGANTAVQAPTTVATSTEPASPFGGGSAIPAPATTQPQQKPIPSASGAGATPVAPLPQAPSVNQSPTQ